VGKAIDTALAALAKMTAGMMDVSLPESAGAATILGVEAYTYHSPWITKTPELYSPPIRAALQRGADIQAGTYANALRDLAKARRDIKTVFSRVDLLVLPTMADPPFKIEEGLNRNPSIAEVNGTVTLQVDRRSAALDVEMMTTRHFEERHCGRIYPPSVIGPRIRRVPTLPL
jgi:Asp-tRNA(Asn)/Glu-tRNA(Gln) amidotransferase A subunit family amidase